jgi:RNA polymerase sigma factor (sigma-70 family)
VRALAGRVLSRLPRDCGIEMSDLVQAGNLGLLQAVRNFSPETGAPLAGYAKFRIRGEILDTVRRHRGRCEGPLPKPAAERSDPTDAGNPIEEKVPAPPGDSPHGLATHGNWSPFWGRKYGSFLRATAKWSSFGIRATAVCEKSARRSACRKAAPARFTAPRSIACGARCGTGESGRSPN